jgi:hypothetical protein
MFWLAAAMRRSMIVEDQMDRRVGRIGRVDELEEPGAVLGSEGELKPAGGLLGESHPRTYSRSRDKTSLLATFP